MLRLRLLKLRSSHYISILEPEEYRENYIKRHAAYKMLADALDDRKTVPVNTIHLLLLAYDMATLKYAAGEYISLLKVFGAQKKEEGMKILKQFSPKQFGKILRGHVRELHQSMEIITQEDAYENGFYGKGNCPECSSWRVNLESQYDVELKIITKRMLYCYQCGKMSDAPKVKLPLSSPTPQITSERIL